MGDQGKRPTRSEREEGRWIATFGGGSTCPGGQPHKADHASLRRKEPRCWRCFAAKVGASAQESTRDTCAGAGKKNGAGDGWPRLQRLFHCHGTMVAL